ncbi:MAG: universal stress protein [Gammaproteobacteria bacterium]|nr:universal stress protein [Gammaproteobacteria bacterium]MDH3856490.1 universal stress protein [Gammaproteobacteria bacterium]
MIKNILVPLDGTERSADVLDTAMVIARRFDAHIKAVHVREHTSEPYMFSGMPAAYREEFARMSSKAVDSVVDTVREQFKNFCTVGKVKVTRKPSKSAGITASLHILEGDAESVLDRESRLVDVIAMSRPTKHRIGGPAVGQLHESLMMHSGRPVLIVPPAPEWQAHRVEHAAIGWNDSVEASRALALTLPWLTQMKKVSVLVSKKREAGVGEVVDYLKQHGCRADYHVIGKKGTNVGKNMLGTCADIGTEFLVVGGFSHTRTRQRLFGGVTSYLLSNTDIITVMAH